MVIIGINKVGSELIGLVHDVAKRCGIHKILPADQQTTEELIRKGEEKLNITFHDRGRVYAETKGDYWLTQLLCQSICLLNDITETSDEPSEVDFSVDQLRQRVISRLENSYLETVKEFCRGKRFRPTNDPYFKLLRCIGQQDGSIVDLTYI